MKRKGHFRFVKINKLLEENGVESNSLDDLMTGQNIRILCPFCIENGEPNRKNSLIVYPTLTFYCFRCHESGMDIKFKSSKSEYKENKMKTEIGSYLKDSKSSFSKYRSVDINHLQNIRSDRYITYFINHRSYKYVPKLDDFNLKEVKLLGRDGIVVPSIYDNKVITYQIRFLDVKFKDQIKYYTDEVDKIPYFPEGFKTDHDYSTITLVEGVFDAMSANILGLPNPIAILGSRINPISMKIITKILKPSNIIFAFDDMKINLKVSHQFEDYLHNTFFIDTDGNDLDEHLRKTNDLPNIYDHYKYLNKVKEKSISKKYLDLKSRPK